MRFLQVEHLQQNPKKNAAGGKPARRRRGKKKAAPAKPRARAKRAPRARRRSAPAAVRKQNVGRKKTRARRSGFYIEVMQQKNSAFRYSYFDGARLTATRARAKTYATSGTAESDAKALMGRLPASYVHARVLPG